MKHPVYSNFKVERIMKFTSSLILFILLILKTYFNLSLILKLLGALKKKQKNGDISSFVYIEHLLYMAFSVNLALLVNLQLFTQYACIKVIFY